MAKWLKIVAIVLFVGICLSSIGVSEASAQDDGVSAALVGEGMIETGGLVAVGAGLVILGAGLGIGRIGSSACEAMARQPDTAGTIQTAMIISAALIEGAAFFALIICMIR